MRLFSYLISSLTGRLLISIILSVTIGVVLLGASGTSGINRFSQTGSDRLLAVVGQATSDSLVWRDGRVVLNPPVATLALLQGRTDKAWYAARMGDRFISGTSDLPMVPVAMTDANHTRFIYADYHGRRVRIVGVMRALQGAPQPVVVQVAQTIGIRARLNYWLVTRVLFNGALLIVILSLLLFFSMRWWLAPWAEVRRQIDNRRADDLQPLHLANVPVEMRSIVTAFNGLLERLRGSMAETRRFTSDASHQMRTPLTILRAHLDVIRREGLDSPKGQASFTDVETAVGRLQRLLTQLLALARAEDAREEVAGLFHPVDLVALARDVAETMVPVALEAGVDLEFETRLNAVQIDSVDTLVQELIGNLVDNAIRYNRRGGIVRIVIDDKPDDASVMVEDDGPGIPEEERGHVFERFRRLTRDHRREGSGLGLSIVKSIAELVGATVAIGPGPGGMGVRAEVRFPPTRSATLA